MIPDRQDRLMPLVMMTRRAALLAALADLPQGELLHNGMINEEDMNLFKLTDDIDEAVDESPASIAATLDRYVGRC